MILSYAYLLVFHGSRDCRTQAAASDLRQLLVTKYKSKNILAQLNCYKTRLPNYELKTLITSDLSKEPLIDIAALELAPTSLNESLVNFAQKAKQQGLKQIKVIPLFLAPGVHVRQDIPAEIALAIKQINNQVTIELSPYLGKYSGIVPLLSRKFAELSAQKRILIAHGSRLSEVNNYYQNLATQLNATIAYWSVAPKFAQHIELQIASGTKKMAIVPYFLFPGKITEAIAKEIVLLQQKHTQVELVLGQPLGATEVLAELIAQEA